MAGTADAARHPSALPFGYELGDYKIGEVLGMGGFAITYAARHVHLKAKSVAIKEYLPSEFAHRDQQSSVTPNSRAEQEVYDWGLQRFIEEANILYDFKDKSHPNIVAVENVITENSTAYIVMDWVPGSTLSQCIKDGRKFSEKQLYQLTNKLLNALEFIHGRDTIHRDISPSNIILTPDHEPILIDFGAARADVKDKLPHSQLFKPGYGPIEQEAGSAQDHRADIYSLAATLYHLTLGVKPMRASQRQISITEKGLDPLGSAQELGKKSYSQPFLAAIDSGLAVMRDKRPSSIKEWRRMFDAAPPLTRLEKLTQQFNAVGNGVRETLAKTTQAMRLGLFAGSGLLALGALAWTLAPTYEDHIANAQDALRGDVADAKVRASAVKAFNAALEDRPTDPSATEGVEGVNSVDRFLTLVQEGKISGAEAALLDAGARLKQHGVADDQLASLMTQLNVYRALVDTKAALVSFDLEAAEQRIERLDVANTPIVLSENLTSAFLLLEEFEEHLADNNLEQALPALTNAEGFIANLGFGNGRVEPARTEYSDAVEPWVESTFATVRDSLTAAPLEEAAMSEAAATLNRISRIDPSAQFPDQASRLVVALATIFRHAKESNYTLIEYAPVIATANQLGFESTFESNLRAAIAQYQIRDAEYPPVLDEVLTRALRNLETLPYNRETLDILKDEFTGVDATRDQLNEQDAAIANLAYEAIEALSSSRERIDNDDMRGALRALSTARDQVKQMPAAPARPFNAAIDQQNKRIVEEVTINREIAAGLRDINDNLGRSEPIRTALTRLQAQLDKYPEHSRLVSLHTALGHLLTAVNSAHACNSADVSVNIERSRRAWHEGMDNDIVDSTRQALRGIDC
ncbi:MAG: serine/threonine-protein kinase [Pseudomonadota bacterium]